MSRPDRLTNRFDFDEYEAYADAFNPLQTDRKARRKRKPKAKHIPKKAQQEIVSEIAENIGGVEGGVSEESFATSYQPSHYEAEWLLSSLRTFYERALITDVEALVKGGKEASVYRCTAHPSTGVEYLAAKVYRPRQFRSLSNDAIYREGRGLIGADGKKIRERDKRAIRAVESRSSYGSLLAHTSWLMHEYNTLQTLYDLDLNVPRPFASAENALLMTYYGDAGQPAPTLIEVRLDEDEAPRLFRNVMRTVEMMLSEGMIHGDLSAYNILYWDGEATLIDFPQVVDAHVNSNAYMLLERDITRVCEYFQRYGVPCDLGHIMNTLWNRYLAPDPQNVIADQSRFYDEDADEDDLDDV
ncbi:MAG: RIO1 family regulatory kinase/ATPase [Chloroflexota bacterium]